MIKYLSTDPWSIVEEGFHVELQRSSESIFSLGNGKFGQRANHEEKFSGKTLQGSYVAGVYYPDKTRVGWWKNGYPEYFAKVLNSAFWVGIDVNINGEEFDLNTWTTENFRRELNMKEGILKRSCVATSPKGTKVQLNAERFCSLANDDVAAIRYSITPLSGAAEIRFGAYIETEVRNHDSNYDELFWKPLHTAVSANGGVAVSETLKTGFQVAWAQEVRFNLNAESTSTHTNTRIENAPVFSVEANSTVTIEKYVGIVSSLNEANEKLSSAAVHTAQAAATEGYDALRAAHVAAWAKVWELGDIVIEGDDEAQQGIRFNIFHLNQTYTGQDSRLNIGPKGFTGEKYGGSTYWDTEAYCMPFYQSTRDSHVAKQLLVYRYNQLDKAIENAAKLGFKNGAALYPMVTMNGEECHNEWEITFEEIHRNGAIAYAIYNYVKYTGDEAHLGEYGIDVLVGIARFWAQRVNWSEAKQAYVMLGVTGPNEYENNINNNWYTNYFAAWCMKYAKEVGEKVHAENAELFKSKCVKMHLNFVEEAADWALKAEKMYFGKLEGTEVFLQQDGFMDKEQLSIHDLDPAERPINQHWSWDRILRSIFIKQADVLQGFFFFEEDFSDAQLKANFDFYEPKTVHESSLSPCVHSILAAKLGYSEKAYEMYLRTSRLDIDDYNHEAHEGLHITSMAGTWMSVTMGFGGMRVKNGELVFNGTLPSQWKSYTFNVLFRGKKYSVKVSAEGTEVETE
jgi:maltose phosphorylase